MCRTTMLSLIGSISIMFRAIYQISPFIPNLYVGTMHNVGPSLKKLMQLCWAHMQMHIACHAEYVANRSGWQPLVAEYASKHVPLVNLQ